MTKKKFALLAVLCGLGISGMLLSQTSGETREKRRIEKIIERGSGDFTMNDNVTITGNATFLGGTTGISVTGLAVSEESVTGTTPTTAILATGTHYIYDMSGATGDTTVTLQAGAANATVRVAITENPNDHALIIDGNGAEKILYGNVQYDDGRLQNVTGWVHFVWDGNNSYWVADDSATFYSGNFNGDLTVDGLLTAQKNAPGATIVGLFKNTSGGTGDFSRVLLGNDASDTVLDLQAFSSNHSTDANYAKILNQQAAPLTLGAYGLADTFTVGNGSVEVYKKNIATTHTYSYLTNEPDGFDKAGSHAILQLQKDVGTTVADNDLVGSISYAITDTSGNMDVGATIRAKVDGTPGANVPTELIFNTHDGTSNEPRMTIASEGKIAMGDDHDPLYDLSVYKTAGTVTTYVSSGSIETGQTVGLKTSSEGFSADIGVTQNDTAGGLCGYAALENINGNVYYMWFDSAGTLRSSTTVSNICGTTGTAH